MISVQTHRKAGAERRTQSVTKAILDFESNVFLRLPMLGIKIILGMLDGHDIARLDTAMVQREGRNALLEAYMNTEVFGTEFPYRLPEYSEISKNPEELCAGLEWMKKRGGVSREFTLRLSGYVKS